MWGINKDSKNDMKAPVGTIETNEEGTSPEPEKVYYIYTYLEAKEVYVYLRNNGCISISSEWGDVEQLGAPFSELDKALKCYNNMSKSARQPLRVHREWVTND